MDDGPLTTSHVADSSHGPNKRKRSLSLEAQQPPAPPAKAAKVHSSHLQINYLARQFSDTLPLLTIDDNLPTIIQLLGDYNGVIERHESLAGNLGARPLGPILIKRFERLFDGPPRVLKSHGKDGVKVSWLDVVEFARHKPEQFNLEKMRDGVRVCQFYTKQSRVEISEEDFFLISSGMPQKLIPPQPIAEDEEKELGTLEIMEKSVAHIIQLADQVSARARQLKHRLTGRRNAIVSRRETEATSLDTGRPSSTVDNATGADDSNSPTSGFVAVNSRPSSAKADGVQNGASSVSSTNGRVYTAATASPSTRAELMSYFNSQRELRNDALSNEHAAGSSKSGGSKSKLKNTSNDPMDYASMLLNAASPVPIPNTPSVLVHYPRPTAADRYDDSGVHKGEMLSRMDAMHRGDRVLPPCDRCRRLHMDCLKNLTACLGCTKKHAKCSWKEVTEQELLDHPHVPSRKDEATGPNADPSKQPEGPPQPVRDEELLGEDDSEDDIRGPSSADRIRPESAREKISASPTPPSKQKNDVPYASLETDDYRTSQGPERFISHNRATDADERPPRENIAQMTSQESTPDLPKTDRREGWERPSERAVAESRT